MGGEYSIQRKRCKILIRKFEGMIFLGRPRHTWEDDIKMDLKLQM
jgi:hypothetical protein